MENQEKQKITEDRPEESLKTMIAFFLSTGFFVGKIPVAPGTLGTLVGIIPILIYWNKGGQYYLLNQISITMAVFLIGIWASTVVVETFKDKDPDYVVIDEIAGYMVGMIGFSPTWEHLLIAFVLFRFFDILKPPPIKLFEKLPSGFGVMTDDIIAGIYTWIAMFFIVNFLGI
ncbi:phosphatidylglycerophosphatase A [Persephonella sp.]|uniref:phosphatidylglycerophosphatase A family protein n=1 Tax=Persephonella sp. TaxID=2060922 RepID=UPI0025E0322B|nr:phosphatidylglycerophosphatase A [Persephonella sp.]